MVKTPCFQCRSAGSIPGLGTKIPHAMLLGGKKKKGRRSLGSAWPRASIVFSTRNSLVLANLNKSAGSGLEWWYLVALGYLGQKKYWLVCES